MKNLIERYVLNKIKTHIYVIEFQKRDLSYVHILIVITLQNNVNLTNANNVVKTVIFDFVINRKLYDLVLKHIIYKNYLKNKNVVCYNDKNNCIKFFPKTLNEIINLNNRLNYLVYEHYAIKYIENTL